jgi:hypothetical protein
MKKLAFSVLLVFLLCFNEAKSYSGQQAYNTNPFLEYIFTMVYFETAMTPCTEVISKPRDALISLVNSTLSMIDNSVKLKGFDKNDVIAKLNAAYDYCEAHPNDMFGKAIIVSLNIDPSKIIKPGTGSNYNNQSSNSPNSGRASVNNRSDNTLQQESGRNVVRNQKEQDSVKFID